METRLPFYAKASLVIIGLISLFAILVIAQDIIVPLIYSLIIAIVINPLIEILVRRKINRIVAVIIVLNLLFIVTSVIVILLTRQLVQFSDSIPFLVKKYDTLIIESERWFSNYFNLKTRDVHLGFIDVRDKIINNSSSWITAAIINTGNAIIILVLIPVYVFMILVYKKHLLDFIHKLFVSSKKEELGAMITSTKGIIQSYLLGLILEVLLMTVLNTTALLIIGIEYAILIGFVGAVLNIIPYIGGIVSALIPIVVAITTKSTEAALWVLAAYILIQLIDNHIIMPKVVASKVKLNALLSVIVVIIGGALWGIPGMFLAIPLTGVLKVIFDHVNGLKPWGFLLGK